MGPYVWKGKTSVSMEGLFPEEEQIVPLKAVVFAPGVYNMSSYRVSWKVGSRCGNGEKSCGAEVVDSVPTLNSTASVKAPTVEEKNPGVGMGSQYLVVVFGR